jgi:DNA invertase Pin-like site-specific DNA recombinase
MSKHKPRHNTDAISTPKIPLEGRFGLIYTRVSSKRQESEGNGLKSQEKRCRQKAKELGVNVTQVFAESATGGGDFTINRPVLVGLIKHIQENRDKRFVVFIDDLKRLARDLVSHMQIRSLLLSLDAHLVCTNYTFEDTPEGEAMEGVTAIFNQLERKQNRRQVIQKITARHHGGYNGFRAPIGYTKTKHVVLGKIDVPNEKSKDIKEALEGFAGMRFITKSDVVRFLQEKMWSAKSKA